LAAMAFDVGRKVRDIKAIPKNPKIIFFIIKLINVLQAEIPSD
jgi:hypothetical protein